MNKQPIVMFLCTHNSCRSQMAQAFLNKYASDRFSAHSAGLEPDQIHPMTLQVMKEIGLDLEAMGYYSKSVITEYFEPQMHLGYLITVCTRAEKNCPIYPFVLERQYWGIEDPASLEGTEEEKLNKFREIRDLIEQKVKLFIEQESA